MTLEQVLQNIERWNVELTRLEAEQNSLPPQRRVALQGQMNALREKIAALRVVAFRSIRQGDLKTFVRALGVPHAYDACLILGIGSLQALVSCTRNQFKLLARPEALGWGAADAIPPQLDMTVVDQVEQVLRSLGQRWRAPNEKPRVKLPEPVVSRDFDHTFRASERFEQSGREFASYAHPLLVYGVANKTRSLIEELAARGVYCWDDLTLKTEQDLIRLGMDRRQVKTVQYEMRRRGLTFAMDQMPASVVMDFIDADRFGDCKPVTEISQEDVIRVRDKDRKLVSVIEADDEYRDRVNSGADDEQLIAPREGEYGVVNDFAEYGEDEGETPVSDDEPAQTNGAKP
jgi:hypothetical protein